MAAYTGAIVMKNALVKQSTTDYGNQVSKARLVPDSNIQTMRTLVPDGQIVDVDSPVWTLELAGVQDHESGGLAAYLTANAGTLVDLVIAPNNATGKVQWTVSVMALPVEFGGETGQFATFDVSLPVSGQPTAGTISA
jgi:hypothetical protein